MRAALDRPSFLSAVNATGARPFGNGQGHCRGRTEMLWSTVRPIINQVWFFARHSSRARIIAAKFLSFIEWTSGGGLFPSSTSTRKSIARRL